jgi:hypothetical protein
MTAAPAAATPATQRMQLRDMLTPLAGTALCAALLPVFLVFGAPFAAWAIGAGFVLGNAVIHAVIAWLVRDASITVALGAMGFSLVFRAGLTALALFFVGAQVGGAGGDQAIGLDRPDLARVAIIVFLIGFTIDAAIDTLRRAAQRDELAQTQETPA